MDNTPTTLDEAVETIWFWEGFEEQVERTKSAAEFVATHHHGVGRAIRNQFLLWDEDSALHQWFRQRGLFHADDMSSVVLKYAWCVFHGKDFDFKEEVDKYTAYWKEYNDR